MPDFLKANPIPEFVDLWDKHPLMFWKKYWADKRANLLPPDFSYAARGKWNPQKQSNYQKSTSLFHSKKKELYIKEL